MTREQELIILCEDGCTVKEAENYLQRGTTVFAAEDFEGNFDNYMEEWFDSWNEEDKQEEIEKHQKMVETKIPLTDWGITKYEGSTYYIMYVN